MTGLRSRCKTLVVRLTVKIQSNYCQNIKAQWKNLRAFLKFLDTITWYLLFVFIYLSIFSVNKFLLNKTFLYLSLNFVLAVPQRLSPKGGCSADVLRIFGGISVHESDFNKVTKRLCWDRASALLFSCGFASCLWNIFLREHLWRTASEQR